MESPVPLRVATLNLLHDPPSWPDRAPLVEAQLLALAPDIVLLQEVACPGEQATSLTASLGDQTGYPYGLHLTEVVAPDRLRPGRLWREGLATLSRFPILTANEPDIGGRVRVCQHLRLGVGALAVAVYNLHLDPFAPELHRNRIAAILHRMDGDPDPAYVILGGDLNATPDSKAVGLVAARLRSAYAIAHGREPEHTRPTPFGLRRDGSAGRRSRFATVDYLFVSERARVASAELAFADPARHDPSLYPSDHYGLVADLELAPG